MAPNAPRPCPALRTWRSRPKWASGLSRCRRGRAIWDSSSRADRRPKWWRPPCGNRTRNCSSTWRRRWRLSGLRLRRHEIGRQRRALAEEVTVHLLQQKFLRLLGAQVEPVLVHEHLHVLHPHLPGFFGNGLVDLLAQRMALERSLVEPFHFALELHTKYLPRPWPDGIIDLVEGAPAAATSHGWISCVLGYYARAPLACEHSPASTP